LLKPLYDWTMAKARGQHAEKALAVVSFAESSFFPIPPDVMLVPMVLANRDRAFRLAGVCTIASVLGGLLGYAIGYFLYETVGRPLLEFYHYEEAYERFRAAFEEWGLWIILIKGLTPIPYKLVTIASGSVAFNLAVFIAASIVTRAARFYMVAALLWKFGPPIRDFIERRLQLVMWAFLIALIGGFVAVKYVF
jgi:membrane protein YqaA with SNARE-associated domain